MTILPISISPCGLNLQVLAFFNTPAYPLAHKKHKKKRTNQQNKSTNETTNQQSTPAASTTMDEMQPTADPARRITIVAFIESNNGHSCANHTCCGDSLVMDHFSDSLLLHLQLTRPNEFAAFYLCQTVWMGATC
jgi:hypothetical protein